MHYTQKRCKLTVVVLLFTGATYNTGVLSNYYSNTTCNIIYRSAHVCWMPLIILKATTNDNSVRGSIMIVLVPGGARLYENSSIPAGLPWCLLVYGYMKIVICLQLQFALLLLPYHVCLTAISIIRKGLLAPSSFCNHSTTKPPNIPDRNHGSRLGVMSSCCNCSTTTPPRLS